MVIRAVVFDIGGVLEKVDDAAWPVTWASRWAARAGMSLDELAAALDRLPPIGDVPTGAASEEEFRHLYATALGLDEARADLMMVELWDAYCGELDAELFAWYVAQRDRAALGILSNSMDGARREDTRRFGIPEAADVVVYSHEVGLAKPDPAVYALTADRLGVAPGEIAFLDDSPVSVDGARAAGWHAVLHTDTRSSVAALEKILADRGADPVDQRGAGSGECGRA